MWGSLDCCVFAFVSEAHCPCLNIIRKYVYVHVLDVCPFTGTSTDVSRYAGEYEHVFDSTTAGVAIQAPQLDINTVAAGGGSRLFFRSGMFVVGPESAGAHPGPTCYGKGKTGIVGRRLCVGHMTVTRLSHDWHVQVT